jgi:hypothetical protein
MRINFTTISILGIISFLALHQETLVAAPAALPSLIDVPGTQWRKSSPNVSRLKKHSSGVPLRLTVHYTGVKQSRKYTIVQKLRSLFVFSTEVIEGAKKKLWGDIPYHFYIDYNGTLAEGRNLDYQPDTNTRYNTDGHITIVVEGDDTDGISDGQKNKLFALMDSIRADMKIPLSRLGIHKQFASTTCPGPAIAVAIEDYKTARAGR